MATASTTTRPPFTISRYTITSADHGDKPRTLRDLNAVQALGAILNKRDWITKWTTQPHVRAKWLAEIEDALVKANVSHVWSEWPNRSVLRTGFEWRDVQRYGGFGFGMFGGGGGGGMVRIRMDSGFDATHRLLTAADMADEQEKRQEIERILAHVMYPPGRYPYDAFREGYKYGSDAAADGDVVLAEDEGEDEDADDHKEDSKSTAQVGARAMDGDDSEDDEGEEYEHEDEDYDEERYEASAIETRFPRVFSDHQPKNAFGQIAWYVAMSVVRDELRDLDAADWTAETISSRTRQIWSSSNQTVVTRACAIIRNVLRSDTSVAMQAVRSQFPDESRKNVLKLLQLHLTKIRALLETTKQDISDVLDLVIKNVCHEKDGTDLTTESLYSPGPAPKTWLSDDCIPAQLKAKFVSEIKALENVPEHKKDWHPNSNEQVLNLVHPSLYCGVATVSQSNLFGIRRPSRAVSPFGFGAQPVAVAGTTGGFGAPAPVPAFGGGAAVGFGDLGALAFGGDVVGGFGGFGAPAVAVPSAAGFGNPAGFGQGPVTLLPKQKTAPIYEHTKMLATSEASNLCSTPAAHMRAIMFAPTPRTLERKQRSGDRFQWLPCEIDVAEVDGTARIRTYINNLHPEDHASLYESIAAIFTRFVPLFDQVVSSLDDALVREQSDAPRPSLRRLTSPPLCEYDSPRFTLMGRRCQVIVKIAEIVLTPEKPEYAGGSWHVEGTDAERIVATGLYYFGSENITESRLAFRTLVQAPYYEQSDNIGVALAYGLKNEEALIQGRGSVTAMEDRCVVFPNILQHKVEPFRLEDPTKPGVRKILAFFLVDPTSDPIPSTAVVPPQQQDWVNRAQESAVTQLRVPDAVVGQIQAMAGDRMSLEQAHAFRLALMDERSPRHTGFYENVVFSLCEH